MSRVPVKNGSFQNGGPSVQWTQFQPPKHTAVPLREQCRIRRFFFFYHDIRAFTTSVSGQGTLPCRLAAGAAAAGGALLGSGCILHSYTDGSVRVCKRVMVYEGQSSYSDAARNTFKSFSVKT